MIHHNFVLSVNEDIMSWKNVILPIGCSGVCCAFHCLVSGFRMFLSLSLSLWICPPLLLSSSPSFFKSKYVSVCLSISSTETFLSLSLSVLLSHFYPPCSYISFPFILSVSFRSPQMRIISKCDDWKLDLNLKRHKNIEKKPKSPGNNTGTLTLTHLSGIE